MNAGHLLKEINNEAFVEIFSRIAILFVKRTPAMLSRARFLVNATSDSDPETRACDRHNFKINIKVPFETASTKYHKKAEYFIYHLNQEASVVLKRTSTVAYIVTN